MKFYSSRGCIVSQTTCPPPRVRDVLIVPAVIAVAIVSAALIAACWPH